MSGSRPLISVVAPAYRTSGCLPELHRRVTAAVEPLTSEFELILVNDCSPDDDWAVITRLAAADRRVKGVDLSRNFGQHYAIAAGIDHARGDWVVVMDADLQDQPEEIPRLYAKALEGYDVVFARRGERHSDPAIKKFFSWLFNRLVNFLSSTRVVQGIANYSVISRRVADELRSLRERARSYGLLVLWLGFPTAYIDVSHGARFAGKSSYSIWGSVPLALNSIVSLSDQPLRISMKIGFFLSGMSTLYALFLVYKYYRFHVAVTGWTSVMVSMFFLAGAIIADLGVIGLYLGKVFDEAKRRPLYVVRRLANLESHADQRS